MTVYSAIFGAVAVTAQQDLFEITTPSTGIAIIHQIIISQSTEEGDIQEEGLRLLLKRGATTTGSGGTTVTPVPLGVGSAAGSTVKANNTTKATSGTIVTLHAETWYIRGSFIILPTPKLQVMLPPSTRLTLELATTPADPITMDGTVYFEELP